MQPSRTHQIRQFLMHHLPTAYPRELTHKERAVIYRMLSMLYSADHTQNNLVKCELRSCALTLWMIVHHPATPVTDYDSALVAYAALPTSLPDHDEVLDFQNFIYQTFEDAWHFDTSPQITDLHSWIYAASDRRASRAERIDRWESLELSLTELHIAYFEHMLSNA